MVKITKLIHFWMVCMHFSIQFWTLTRIRIRNLEFRIRIRQKVADPCGSGSGSTTLPDIVSWLCRARWCSQGRWSPATSSEPSWTRWSEPATYSSPSSSPTPFTKKTVRVVLADPTLSSVTCPAKTRVRSLMFSDSESLFYRMPSIPVW
jgi:hypothetical protein